MCQRREMCNDRVCDSAEHDRYEETKNGAYRIPRTFSHANKSVTLYTQFAKGLETSFTAQECKTRFGVVVNPISMLLVHTMSSEWLLVVGGEVP